MSSPANLPGGGWCVYIVENGLAAATRSPLPLPVVAADRSCCRSSPLPIVAAAARRRCTSSGECPLHLSQLYGRGARRASARLRAHSCVPCFLPWRVVGECCAAPPDGIQSRAETSPRRLQRRARRAVADCCRPAGIPACVVVQWHLASFVVVRRRCRVGVTHL